MKLTKLLCLLLLVAAAYWSIRSLMPSYQENKPVATDHFSVDRALKHVEEISVAPHAVGFKAHATVRAYITKALKEMGLEVTIQEGKTIGDWGNLSNAVNIISKIPGTNPNGKALLLLSHYDSNPHSSYGASDAGSGVATILEGVRAFLENKKEPKNDIIIVFTDAEELGLNGANLFVTQHPWAKNVGLVLNFEARGSGGPSYMLIETNRKNAKLIREFTRANPKYPVANSLLYSIYKMLPNDTDLTVFREKADIDGFNFAFIDDHFDYHTALDTYDRLDRNTLAHQGSYLIPLLDYFSQADLTDIKSLTDYIYFNFPIFGLVSYPFDWIWPMFILACILFVAILIHGLKNKSIGLKGLWLGFVPLIIVLLINGLAGYISWPALKWWYPWYQDMLHGFTYNGHLYIFIMAIFSLSVCLLVYNRFKKVGTASLLVAPMFLWLVVCAMLSSYLEGASFFIIPVFGTLAAWYVVTNQKEPSPFLLVFLALPAVFIFVPFIQMFPVGLGLKLLVASTLFTTLLYFLLLPFFGLLKHKKRYMVIGVVLFFVFGIKAHIKSGYNSECPKPNSLLYVYNADTQKANWATYDNVLSEWNQQFLKTENPNDSTSALNIISSKYNTKFTHTAEAPIKSLKSPEIMVVQDTVIGSLRKLNICVTHQREVNRLEVFTNKTPIKNAVINGQSITEDFLEKRNSGRLFTHYISNNDFTEIELTIENHSPLELTFYEASNDLLSNPLFTVPKRPAENIPMPFVLNDAILLIKSITIE
ncbi:peptidase M28 [Croceivirga radicis]|uniref:Vacuolar membrane protease n=1 Tax=Croceivirga radicis TaxID=1929488 RepID=A0A1V6LV41_9FLAO|nr:M20/M25/M40 family metallo-hydrolase [Croceivirga radicis]OQD43998.1 peptidase M28 [Croceivirga radicis]